MISMILKISKFALLIIIIALMMSCSHTNQINKLENKLIDEEITSKRSRELVGEILAIDKYNVKATKRLIDYYWHKNYLDSTNIHFNNLLLENSNDTQAYLFTSENRYEYFSLNDTNRIIVLKKGLSIDSNCQNINYKLGIYYYQLFIWKFKEDSTNILLDYYAKSSQYYFDKLINIKSPLYEVAKYPLIQVTSYLKDTTKTNYYEKLKPYTTSNYFHLDKFVDSQLEFEYYKNWKYDYTKNIYEPVIHDYSWITSYSNVLKSLDEPNIFEINSDKVFRLSFSESIWKNEYHIIRFEDKSDSIFISWKTYNRNSTTDEIIISQNEVKILSTKEWNSFENLINDIDFWNMENIFEGVLDGTSWILEGKIGEKYNSVRRISPSQETKFYQLCLFLINKTDIELNSKPRIRWVF
jgi:hypothetical protein